MYAYELFFIFLAGCGIGIIARYILGYRKKHWALVSINLLMGLAMCTYSTFVWGEDYTEIFISGLLGIIGNLGYCVFKLIAFFA